MRRTTAGLATSTLVCGLLVAKPMLASAAELEADGMASLRVAIDTANASPEADTITLTGGLGAYAIEAGGPGEDENASGDLDVIGGGGLTIEGNDNRINGLSRDRIFDLRSGSLTVDDLQLNTGAAPATETDGGIRAAADTVLGGDGVTFFSNTALNPGTPAATPPAAAGPSRPREP